MNIIVFALVVIALGVGGLGVILADDMLHSDEENYAGFSDWWVLSSMAAVNLGFFVLLVALIWEAVVWLSV